MTTNEKEVICEVIKTVSLIASRQGEILGCLEKTLGLHTSLLLNGENQVMHDLNALAILLEKAKNL